MPAIDWESVKNQKVSIGLVITVGAVTLWLYGWLSDNFVTKAEAAQYHTELSKQVAGNTTILTEHIREFRLNSALSRVDSLDAKVYRMQHGPADPETLREVENQLANAILYRDCLLQARPNCETLAKLIR